MNNEFWKRKLSAFLHDTPTKALDIRSHEERAKAAAARVETGNGFDKSADHKAAAADRIPFPSASSLRCAFNGVDNRFHHPLGGSPAAEAQYQFPMKFTSPGQAEECEQVVQPGQLVKSGISAVEIPRADFFAHWRLWPAWLSEKDARCAFLPADTRIPDHTIFNHCSVTAAFAGIGDDSPAFLRFHIGPVQSFIAAARSTRDLWSGSFLLSWLITSGLKKLSECIGPDAVIFPNLHGQPLFDFLWRGELWDKMRSHAKSGKTIWDTLRWMPEKILTPNFPNTFLALIPWSRADELGRMTEDAVRGEWRKIAEASWEFAVKEDEEENRRRFDRQADRHLSISWQATPFPQTLDDAAKIAEETLPDRKIPERFRRVRQTFEKDIPEKHRDGRFYTDNAKTRLNNIGLAWPLIVALSAWRLDAVRQTRAFSGWSIGGAKENRRRDKDALNSREEAVFCRATKNDVLTEQALREFVHEDSVGATTLIKRVWHCAYLIKKIGFEPGDFTMPNTRAVALHADECKEERGKTGEDACYFAVIAFDGDDIGKWVSGEKAPLFNSQLADYTEDGERKGALDYFKKHAADILKTRRPVTPSYHLQFSQALSNFAVHIVPRVVEAHGGRLIYAGGDDVLAMLPAASAIDCADDLQRVFSGEAPKKENRIEKVAPGFLSVEKDQNGNPVPLLVPGSAASASCGIAMAHYKEPLQDVVREAQDAEKRAKKYFKNEKNALAVSVIKHSGEISQWTASFKPDNGALSAYRCIMNAMYKNVISRKFPHRLLEFIAPYRSINNKGMSDDPDFDFAKVVERDLDTVLDRQRGADYNTDAGEKLRNDLRDAVREYLKAIKGDSTAEKHEQAQHHFVQVAEDRPIKADSTAKKCEHEQFAGMLTVAAFLARQEKNNV